MMDVEQSGPIPSTAKDGEIDRIMALIRDRVQARKLGAGMARRANGAAGEEPQDDAGDAGFPLAVTRLLTLLAQRLRACQEHLSGVEEWLRDETERGAQQDQDLRGRMTAVASVCERLEGQVTALTARVDALTAVQAPRPLDAAAPRAAAVPGENGGADDIGALILQLQVLSGRLLSALGHPDTRGPAVHAEQAKAGAASGAIRTIFRPGTWNDAGDLHGQ